jgi:hypothetical protein
MWIGTALLILRAGASIIQSGYHVATGRFAVTSVGVWEPWFYLGAVLFGVCVWRHWRQPFGSATAPAAPQQTVRA